MIENKEINIIAKCHTRESMKSENSQMILKDRELLVETEGEGVEFTARFKMGDGKTPYNQLRYISSLYDLFPNFRLCTEDYSMSININLKE